MYLKCLNCSYYSILHNCLEKTSLILILRTYEQLILIVHLAHHLGQASSGGIGLGNTAFSEHWLSQQQFVSHRYLEFEVVLWYLILYFCCCCCYFFFFFYFFFILFFFHELIHLSLEPIKSFNIYNILR